jgi:hypothetical protein
MATIIEKTANALYKHPERTVATFPSGLMRIDQNYSCRNEAEVTHRNTLAVGNELPDDDGYPAMDGAFIFPHCQQVRRGSGFTEFTASAYGRTTDQPTNFITEIIKIETPDVGHYNLLTFTADIVLRTGESLDPSVLNIDPSLLDPFDLFYLSPQNTVKSIASSVRNLQSGSSFNETGISIPTTANLIRNYTIVFNLDPSGIINPGDPETITFFLQLREPLIRVAAQSNFGKFTEYKISLDYQTDPGFQQFIPES